MSVSLLVVGVLIPVVFGRDQLTSLIGMCFAVVAAYFYGKAIQK
jgi:Sec-independent protein translocase protein TatA